MCGVRFPAHSEAGARTIGVARVHAMRLFEVSLLSPSGSSRGDLGSRCMQRGREGGEREHTPGAHRHRSAAAAHICSPSHHRTPFRTCKVPQRPRRPRRSAFCRRTAVRESVHSGEASQDRMRVSTRTGAARPGPEPGCPRNRACGPRTCRRPGQARVLAPSASSSRPCATAAETDQLQ